MQTLQVALLSSRAMSLVPPSPVELQFFTVDLLKWYHRTNWCNYFSDIIFYRRVCHERQGIPSRSLWHRNKQIDFLTPGLDHTCHVQINYLVEECKYEEFSFSRSSRCRRTLFDTTSDVNLCTPISMIVRLTMAEIEQMLSAIDKTVSLNLTCPLVRLIM